MRAPKEFGQYEGLKGTGYEYTFRYNKLSDQSQRTKHLYVLLLFPNATEI